jgi:hypothetical protein
MNILEIEDLIKGLPDQALMQEAQQPSGRMPQYLVVSEIQRRGDMRKRFESQQQGQDRGTIAQQILQGGVQEGPAPQAQAPMGQPPGMMPQGMPPQGMPPGPPMGAPQGIAALPQGGGIPGPQAAQMAAQAPVRMAEGRQAPSIYDLRRDPFLVNMGLVQPRTEVSAAQMSELDALAGQLGALDSTFAQTREELRATPQATPRQDALGELELGRTPLSRVGETLGDISSEAFRFAAMPGMQAAEAAYNVPYKVGDAIRYLTTPSTTFAELTEDLDPESAFVDIMPRVVSDPAQSGAVKTDAARLADYNLNAGYGEEPFVSGAKTSLDETLLGLGLSDTDPREKVQQDVLGARLGGDPTGSYNLGDVSGIGSVGAAQTLLANIPKVTPERDEEGKMIGLGEGVSPFQVELAKNIRAAEQPGRSYAELIEKVKESRARDYGEGTAAAAALRAESEAEQERLKKEGRSAALSDALIALGAGIAGGDLSGGLARAGQAATAARKEFDTAARQERRYGTLEARAEERAARAARSAAEMQELGLMGRQVEADYEAEIAKINRNLEADKVLASAAERLGADRRAAEQFLVSTRAKAESLMAQLAQLDQEDRKQAELSSRAIADFLEEVVKGDLPAGLQMKSPEEQANYRRRVIRQYIPDLEAVFGRKIKLEDIEDGPAVDDAGRPSLSAFDR